MCFITFEGIDGAGKSTHIQPLAELLRSKGFNVVVTREPGGTPIGEKLREMILNEKMDPITELLLAFAARREHLVQVIEPALARGDVVISDRFTDSTYAYQGFGRDLNLRDISRLEEIVQDRADFPVPLPIYKRLDFSAGIRRPDLTLLYVVSPETAEERMDGNRTLDKFESMPQMFYRKVLDGYKRQCETDPKRFEIIDASVSVQDVWTKTVAAVTRSSVGKQLKFPQ